MRRLITDEQVGRYPSGLITKWKEPAVYYSQSLKLSTFLLRPLQQKSPEESSSVIFCARKFKETSHYIFPELKSYIATCLLVLSQLKNFRELAESVSRLAEKNVSSICFQKQKFNLIFHCPLLLVTFFTSVEVLWQWRLTYEVKKERSYYFFIRFVNSNQFGPT